jgi:hypothetical protein
MARCSFAVRCWMVASSKSPVWLAYRLTEQDLTQPSASRDPGRVALEGTYAPSLRCATLPCSTSAFGLVDGVDGGWGRMDGKVERIK